MSDTAMTELSKDLATSDGLGGATRIADSVVARIAGMAAREVEGVFDLSHRTLSSAIAGQVSQRLTGGGEKKDTGVAVQVGQKETIIDLNIVVLYETSIPEVAANIRRNIADRVTGMTGLIVKEVNITVTDMKFPSDELRAEPEPRVQ